MKNITFICIGSNKVIGDSFGPLVGTLLKNKYKEKNNIKIYGDIINPVNYKNIEFIYNSIDKKDTIILIDSALGQNVGDVIINEGGLKIGESLDKKKKIYGNLSIKGIVGLNHNNWFDNFLELKNVDISIIRNLIKNVVDVIDV